MGADVNVSIGVSLRELQQGLNQAGGMVKDFKQEASKARETAMFLSNAIGSIGGASKGAAAMAGNLLGGFAIGGPMGLAIGGVNALIQVFKDFNSEQSQAAATAKELLKTLEDQRTQGMRARDNLELQNKLLNAKTEKEKAELQGAADLASKLEELNDARKKSAEIKDVTSQQRATADQVVVIAEQRVANQRLVNITRIRLAEEADAKKSADLATQATKKEQDELNKRASAGQAALDARARKYEAAQRKEVEDAKVAGKQKVDALTQAGEAEIAALDLQAAKRRLLESQQARGSGALPQDLQSAEDEARTRAERRMALIKDEYTLKRRLIEDSTWDSDADKKYQLEVLGQEEKLKLMREEIILTEKLTTISGTALDRTKEATRAAAQEMKSYLAPLANGFQQLFDGVIQGGQNMGQMLSSIFKSMLSQFVGILIQLGLEKVAAGIASHAAEKPVKVAEVTNAAGVAGAEAAAAMAGIPIVGPALAAAAMAETSALVLSSMLPLAAASGGFDIGNFNPVTQLHAKEMVLPAYLAERVRNMTEMPTQPTNVQVVISAVDSKSVERLFNDNQGALIQSIRTAVRNGRV